ncbi:50S ribosomal protein L21, chloroplastic-like [Dioscorea cayenensis subsp. rotundata]|uniref:50S ribosomal protein L21, chloroplastic-like n=1 Tax=Dioscorea cayennensis subsp. rotundata TaxID=55577 RepID=A0AB40ASA2_DIOCR|nr:50S ribosomal protein L21, chloroplastic-like [Dioscorea cayenensis subsp. rotundata]
MASTLGAFASPSSAIKLTPKIQFPSFNPLFLSRSHSNRLLALPSSPSSPLRIFSQRWKLSVAPEALEVDEKPPEPEPVEVQIEASLASDAKGKPEDVFAVVMVGSRQYIVFPGRFIYTQRLKGANVNDKIVLNKVLLVGTRTKAYIGEPVVTNAAVHAVVEEQGLNRKVIVFKYKKKKNYRRNIGHRQPNTRIRITGITGYEDFPAETLPAPA